MLHVRVLYCVLLAGTPKSNRAIIVNINYCHNKVELVTEKCLLDMPVIFMCLTFN